METSPFTTNTAIRDGLGLEVVVDPLDYPLLESHGSCSLVLRMQFRIVAGRW